MKRIVLIAGLLAVVVGAGAAVRAWLAERSQQSVFPAANASALLNPLRRFLMPSTKTLEEIGVGPNQTVLEVGAGPGYFSIEATKLVWPKGRLVCLDVQPEMLRILAARLSEAGAVADLLAGDGSRLPFRDASFDRAFLVTVLGEIHAMDAAVAELARILKAGGVLGLAETLLDPDYVREGRLRTMCAAAGLEPVSLRRHAHGYVACFRRSA